MARPKDMPQIPSISYLNQQKVQEELPKMQLLILRECWKEKAEKERQNQKMQWTKQNKSQKIT